MERQRSITLPWKPYGKKSPTRRVSLDEEEHDVVCDYEGDPIAEGIKKHKLSRAGHQAAIPAIKVSDNGDDNLAGPFCRCRVYSLFKSSLPVKEDGSYDFDKATR